MQGAYILRARVENQANAQCCQLTEAIVCIVACISTSYPQLMQSLLLLLLQFRVIITSTISWRRHHQLVLCQILEYSVTQVLELLVSKTGL